jgi:hypothetical protein
VNARSATAAAFVVSLGVLYWFFAGGLVQEPAARYRIDRSSLIAGTRAR